MQNRRWNRTQNRIENGTEINTCDRIENRIENRTENRIENINIQGVETKENHRQTEDYLRKQPEYTF